MTQKRHSIPLAGKMPDLKILSLRSIFIIPQKVQFVKRFVKKTLWATIGRPFFYTNSKTKNQPVILSEVEVSPSEERGETKAPKRRRDLVTSLGGFLYRCNIQYGKPPKFARRSHRRCRSSVLYRYSLNKTSTSQNASVFLRSE